MKMANFLRQISVHIKKFVFFYNIVYIFPEKVSEKLS